MGPTQTPAEDHRVDSTLRVGSGDICVIYTYPTSHDGSMVDWDIYLQIYHTNQRLNVGKHTSSIDPTGYTYIYICILINIHGMMAFYGPTPNPSGVCWKGSRSEM